MFTLLECVAYAEMAGLTDGLDDGEAQAVGVLPHMLATIETVEEASSIQCLAIACVGYAQCALLYIYINVAVGLAVDIGVAQEVAHERGHEFIVGLECPLALFVEVHGDILSFVHLGKHLHLVMQLGVEVYLGVLYVLVVLNLGQEE